MGNDLLHWMPMSPVGAFLFSISLNILIAISGILPSAAITAGNIVFFGFKTGLIISIIGEAAGAVVSFIIYRKSLNKLFTSEQVRNKLVKKLKNTQNMTAFLLVLILRILPFVPSGAITLAAAYSQMGLFSFSIASTLGKVPSLLIEAYSVGIVLELTLVWQISVVIFISIVIIVSRLWKQKMAK